MKKILVMMIFLFACQSLLALEMTELIDCPTAGILQKGEVKFPINIFDQGGVSFGAGVGVLPKLMFGIQYGGEYIIGDSIPQWDSYPGVFVKYRIFDESPTLPAPHPSTHKSPDPRLRALRCTNWRLRHPMRTGQQ